MGTILRIVGPTGALSLVGIGLGMIRLEEFLIARIIFWISAAFFGTTDFIWQLTTRDEWWFRAISGTVTSIVLLTIFPILLRWLQKRKLMAGKRQPSVPPS